VSNSDQRRDDISLEAAEWVIRLNNPSTSFDSAAFNKWLEDPAHRLAFEEAKEHWASFDLMRELPLNARNRGSRYFSHRFQPGYWAAAAAITFLLGGAVFLSNPDLAAVWSADYRTGTAELRGIELPDGSRVELGARSAFDLHYSDTAREVNLISGEAFFTVAPMNATERRPFTVTAGSVKTTALGTQFETEIVAGATKVVDFEHQISVEAATGEGKLILSPGDGIAYDKSNGFGAIQKVVLKNAGAWRQGYLIFDDVPLSDVVAKLNLYQRTRIVIANKALAGRSVTGIFKTSDIDKAVDTIARELEAGKTSLPFVTLLF